jgi:Uma2 family endonuclease
MVQTELTLDDLEQMPDEWVHRELINGELLELPRPDLTHIRTAKRIYDLLNTYCQEENLGEVFHEAGYKVTSDKRNWIQPDVSYVTEIRQDETGRFLFRAPDLAVEVISPSERPKFIAAKRTVFFDNGCQEIWIVRPKSHKIEIWTRDTPERILTGDETLSSPLFPGWSMRVSELFG